MEISLRPPLDGNPLIAQGYGDNPRTYKMFGLDGHNGVDYLVQQGAVVRASHDGVVTFAGDGGKSAVMGSAAGLCVLIVADTQTHATEYAHLRNVWCRQGQRVKAGQIIGCSGRTGMVSGAHLHWGLIPLPIDMKNGYMGRIDPLPYLNAGGTTTGVDGPTEDAGEVAEHVGR
ncbi:M23 family metallopeptidase [Cellulosimicrobium funkei]|nr:M23 family metallopeptidase [Cellulosimicrobium funkei]